MTSDVSADYLVGTATADITPPVGIPLAGFGFRSSHSSTGVYHPLRAVAMVIDDGRTPVVIVSAEWVGFADLTDRVRAMVSQATGVPEAQIILSATHTHCGPAVRRSDRESYGWLDEQEYLATAVDRITRMVAQAWRGRSTARLSYGVGKCGFSVNRRRSGPAGQTVQAPNPGGPTDPDVGVLVVRSTADTPVHPSSDGVRGIAFSYACHPTAHAGLHIGGDYVSFAYDYLDSAFDNAQPCFLQGCAGDQKPRPSRPDADQFEWQDLDSVRELGYQLGRSVQDVIQGGAVEPVGGPIRVDRSIITLQTEPATRADLLANLRAEVPAYKRQWARRMLDLIERGLPQPARFPFEIQTVAFGESLLIIAMAGEMTVEHGLRLKRDFGSEFRFVLPLGYANDMAGYVPVRRQHSEGGYEVLDANQFHGRSGRYVAGTEDLIHGRIRRMVE